MLCDVCRRRHSDGTGHYDTYLYELAGDFTAETWGHQHPTLEDAWKCAAWFNPEHPFDVVWITEDGHVGMTCRREDDTINAGASRQEGSTE